MDSHATLIAEITRLKAELAEACWIIAHAESSDQPDRRGIIVWHSRKREWLNAHKEAKP